MSERVAYGGHWWKIEDDVVLIFDEANNEWDIWEGALADPLPPPHFIEGRETALTGRPWPSFVLLKTLIAVFLVLGIANLVIDVAYNVIFLDPEASFDSQDLLRQLTFAQAATNVGWQLALGGVIAVAAVSVHRYIHERALINED